MAAARTVSRLFPLITTACLASCAGTFAVCRSLPSFTTTALRRLLRCFSSTTPSTTASSNMPSGVQERDGGPARLDECDFKHWFVVMESPDSELTRLCEQFFVVHCKSCSVAEQIVVAELAGWFISFWGSVLIANLLFKKPNCCSACIQRRMHYRNMEGDRVGGQGMEHAARGR